MKGKRWWILSLLVPLLLSGCGSKTRQRYSRVWYDVFDTVITLTVYADDEAAFERAAAAFSSKVYHLHAVFDRYEAHEGVNGLYALNAADGAWVKVEPELYDLLEKCREWGAGGRVNPALGNVLSLWSQYREAGEALPTDEELARAASHADFETLELKDGRARLNDPEVQIDLGAVAKGYATALLGETMAEYAGGSFFIDAGGNVLAAGTPDNARGVWTVGVADPDGGDVLLALMLTDLCAVTSGDYQRYYEIDGVRYHHLIDPGTLYPARHMRQATVIAADSGYADYLSTLLFLTPVDEALALAEALEGVEAILVTNAGEIRMTTGVEGLVIS